MTCFVFICSVSNLHDRWFKDCADYRDLYEQVDDVNRKQRFDWGQGLAEKQVGLFLCSISCFLKI